MKVKLYFFILISTLITTYSYAQPRCDIFYDKLKNDYALLELDDTRIVEAKTFGFNVQVYFDENLARIIYPGDSKYEAGDAARECKGN